MGMKFNTGSSTLTAILFSAVLLPAIFSQSACTTTLVSPGATTLSKDRIAEIITSPDRTPADRNADASRKPDQVLSFIGVRSGMLALDLGASGGYTTELLARAVGSTGRVYGQSAPRNPDSQPLPAGRLTSPQALTARAQNPAVANITPVARKFEDPVPPEVASSGLDLVTFMFNYHDLGHMGVDRSKLNRAVFTALKSGGIYVIADHSGRPGTGISEAGTLHRIEEAFLRQEVESAGFKFVEEGNFLRNPSDPRDKNQPEASQPKDNFILKFAKP